GPTLRDHRQGGAVRQQRQPLEPQDAAALPAQSADDVADERCARPAGAPAPDHQRHPHDRTQWRPRRLSEGHRRHQADARAAPAEAAHRAGRGAHRLLTATWGRPGKPAAARAFCCPGPGGPPPSRPDPRIRLPGAVMADPADFPNLRLLDHPLVQHKLTLLRERSTPTAHFRRLLREIAMLMAYEVTRDLPLV